MSKKQAILAQFGTAIAAIIGTVVGILLQGFAGESLIFMTAGGFVYLAAVNILPELLDEDSSSFRFRLLQILFFVAGIAFMFSVTILEEMSKSCLDSMIFVVVVAVVVVAVITLVLTRIHVLRFTHLYCLLFQGGHSHGHHEHGHHHEHQHHNLEEVPVEAHDHHHHEHHHDHHHHEHHHHDHGEL